LELGFRDTASLVRKHALRLKLGRGVAPLAVMRAALADPDSGVRALAASLTPKYAADPEIAAQVPAMLLEFLQREQHPYAFRKMHQALEKITHQELALPADAELDAQARARTVKAWVEARSSRW
jgi:hypothetical protein